MAVIVEHLGPKLKKELKQADEIWVAVALMTQDGLNHILDSAPTGSQQNYVVGTDLPTDPKALKKLLKLGLKPNVSASLFAEKEFYHPKVYLIRQGNQYVAFMGSANCTLAGLDRNIEISIKLDDQRSCEELLTWFQKLHAVAKPISQSFLNKYTAEFQARRRREKEDEKVAREQKKVLNEEYEAFINERGELLRVLKNYRKDKSYTTVKSDRAKVIQELRVTLDYPNFANIDIDAFFKIWELGHIIALPKPIIKREIKKFSRLLKMICDDSTDIAIRYDKALQGSLKIRGVGEGLISKVITIHDPKNYFVKNDMSDAALRKYGVQLPRGLSKGTKYKVMAESLKQICKETKIDDLAVLDYYLYREGQQ